MAGDGQDEEDDDRPEDEGQRPYLKDAARQQNASETEKRVTQ